METVSVTDLAAITALGESAPIRAEIGALTLIENSNLALASLSVPRGQNVPMIFEMTLPEVGQWQAGADISAFWTAPNQWIIEGHNRANEDFAELVKRAAPDCCVTEQTDGWVAFDIFSNDGSKPIADLLEKLVNIDVNALKTGTAVRTGLHHMSVYLIRRRDDQITIFGMRSLAGALCHALETAAMRLR